MGMEKSEYQKSGYVTKQAAFLKAYLIGLINKQPLHGYNYYEEIVKAFRADGYEPTKTEVYRALHDMIREEMIYQVRRKVPEAEFKEVKIYHFAEPNGYDKAVKYVEEVKADLERSVQLLEKAKISMTGVLK
jgi:DNA-binding PadR family transcriptional regulator